MNKILIYLDTCSIQRPLDDRSQLRINLEAEAMLTVLRLVEIGKLQLLSSDVLRFEILCITDINRRLKTEQFLKLAYNTAPIKTSTKTLSSQIIAMGIKPFDALHVAVALENHVNYFCTCDDKLLKKVRSLTFNEDVKFVSPFELVMEIIA